MCWPEYLFFWFFSVCISEPAGDSNSLLKEFLEEKKKTLSNRAALRIYNIQITSHC